MRYGQGPTRYRQLHRTQPVEKEQYRGVWQGQSVSFDRVFRGHRLTDAECEALCRGESIDVYHLGHPEARYGVRIRLEEMVFRGVMKVYRSIGCKTIENLPERPDGEEVPEWMRGLPPIPEDRVPEEIRPELAVDEPDTLDEAYRAELTVPDLPEVTLVTGFEMGSAEEIRKVPAAKEEPVVSQTPQETFVLAEEDDFDGADLEVIEDTEEEQLLTDSPDNPYGAKKAES